MSQLLPLCQVWRFNWLGIPADQLSQEALKLLPPMLQLYPRELSQYSQQLCRIFSIKTQLRREYEIIFVRRADCTDWVGFGVQDNIRVTARPANLPAQKAGDFTSLQLQNLAAAAFCCVAPRQWSHLSSGLHSAFQYLPICMLLACYS